MTTWANLDTYTQYLVDDTGGQYWTAGASGTIRSELESAELLIGMFRRLTELGTQYSFIAGQATQDIGSTYLIPLRISLSDVPLRKTTLAALTRLDENLRLTQGTPECWYLLGTDKLGLYPVPSTNTTVEAVVLRVPPTAQSSGSPVIGAEWHDALPEYAAAILKGSEGKIEEATELLRSFLDKVKIRYPRFLRGAAQQNADSSYRPHTQVVD